MGVSEVDRSLLPSLSALSGVATGPALMDQIWPWLLGSVNPVLAAGWPFLESLKSA